MRDRGKRLQVDGGSTPETTCRKHPGSSAAGVCAYCLKERLFGLVCSDCGEHRISSCTCSSVPSIRATIENDAAKKSGFWKMGRFRLFGPKPEKRKSVSEERFIECRPQLTRSRSLCSFRNVGVLHSEDMGSLSGRRSSVAAARSSGFNRGDSGLTVEDDSRFIELRFEHSVGGSFRNPRNSEFEGGGPRSGRRSFKNFRKIFSHRFSSSKDDDAPTKNCKGKHN